VVLSVNGLNHGPIAEGGPPELITLLLGTWRRTATLRTLSTKAFFPQGCDW
jgi:hypothetical protein